MNNCTLIEILRTYQVFGLAIFDWTLTYISAYFIAYIVFTILKYFKVIRSTKSNSRMLIFSTFITLVGSAIYIHYLFGIHTMLGYYLGLNDYPNVVKCFDINQIDSYDITLNYTIEQIDPYHPLYYNSQ
jgi:hypothetical protein